MQIEFRSRVEYVGNGNPVYATEHLKGFKGIVTKPIWTVGEHSFAEVTFIDDGGTRCVYVENLKLIP